MAPVPFVSSVPGKGRSAEHLWQEHSADLLSYEAIYGKRAVECGERQASSFSLHSGTGCELLMV